MVNRAGSWGLSLFVLFERSLVNSMFDSCSWGLSLFVLFELRVLIRSKK